MVNDDDDDDDEDGPWSLQVAYHVVAHFTYAQCYMLYLHLLSLLFSITLLLPPLYSEALTA